VKIRLAVLLSSSLLIPALASLAADPKPGDRLERKGDEIVVCGQFFHTGTPVVTWMDPGGYDAYRVERRFAPMKEADWKTTQAVTKVPLPNRFSIRKGLPPEEAEKVRGGGWDLAALQDVVDQFVIHFDACGTSRRCYEVLHDERGLSVHFMLDLDGTIYQTLDLKEGAWHATKANGRSIGIEIANIGTAPADGPNKFDRWYRREADGKTSITIPGPAASTGIRNTAIPLRPSRAEPVVGMVQGQSLKQYDLTPQQYESLIKLTATLRAAFPKIKLDYPRGEDGSLLRVKLPDDEYTRYQGLLGHFHVQTNKVDPGPAFQWDRLIDGVKAIEAKR
jgi:N-acetylmuramoyl-L-alanine amidase